jgi:hypothetical protein
MPDVKRTTIATGGKLEPQRKNNYFITLVPPSGQIVQFWLKTFPFPETTNSVKKTPYFNEERKWAGEVTVADVTVTLNEYVDVRASEAMAEWRAKVFDPETGLVGRTGDYKIDGTMHYLSPDLNPSEEKKWELQGVWPSSFKAGDGDMASADQVEVSVTLVIDLVKPI